MKLYLCSRCKRPKPATEFNKANRYSHRESLQYYCKECVCAAHKENRVRKRATHAFRDRRWVCNRLHAPTSHIRNPRMIAQRKRFKQSGITTAEHAGIDFMSYYQLERGQKNPLRETGVWRTTVLRLCEYWGCDPEEIFPQAGLERGDVQPGSAELGASQYSQELCSGQLENSLIRAENLRWLVSSIGQMAPKRKDVLMKHLFDKLSLEEIARRRGASGPATANLLIGALNWLTCRAQGAEAPVRTSVKAFFR